MRILAITGSPRGRQSTTRQLVELVLEGAKSAGAEVELIDLSEIKVGYCTACMACHIGGKCPIKDDFAPVLDKMLSSDGLIFGSPNYFNSVTAQLKTAIDRLSGPIHCQQFLGKYACSVGSAGGPEHELVTTYMNDILIRLGCAVVGAVGASPGIPGSLDTAKEAASVLGRELVEAITEKRAYPEQEAVHAAMHERFKYLVNANKDNWPYEYQYWQSKGWL